VETLLWIVIWLGALGYIFYNRIDLYTGSIASTVLLIIISALSSFSVISLVVFWLLFLAIVIPLNYNTFRIEYLSKPVYKLIKKTLPTLSKTEQTAIDAGHVWLEAELFRGKPDWNAFEKLPSATLTKEEQDFIDGPLTELCSMVDDWDATHKDYGISPKIWDFIKKNKFLSIIIPKEYGGLEFSAYAHSEIVSRLSSKSITVGISVSVPNSLGPAELLMHYGTDKQKKHYLPRLAKGEDIPCFALTNPEAGSDAGAIPDSGVVCKGTFNGKEIIGINLNFNKRYITLAPIATVIGLAFKLYDPDNLLGENIKEYGITCALIPKETKGVSTGTRHLPLNVPFSNGPVRGENVFIPLDYIIGDVEMAGKGWKMLVECLAVGRGISLPSASTGLARFTALATSAYSKIRKQFGVPLCEFEGIQESLARVIGYTYLADSARTIATVGIDQGIKPSIVSAITKYHTTEFARLAGIDAMDIQGGKGICLGPNNYTGRPFQSTPIAVTVEGANILTRCMIIFGQGAIRCHPYLLEEMQTIRDEDLIQFDKVFFTHLGYSVSNFVKTLWLGLTNGRFSKTPSYAKDTKTKRYYQQINRFSAATSLLSDISLAMLGGSLKRRESLSAKLGDMLSYTYLATATLKYYADQGSKAESLPLVDWSMKYLFNKTQTTIDDFLDNFPNKFIGKLLKLVVFPTGKHTKKPSDKNNKQVCDLFTRPSEARTQLGVNLTHPNEKNNHLHLLDEALAATILAEPLDSKISKACKAGIISKELPYHDRLEMAYDKKIINKEEYKIISKSYDLMLKVIAVDEFTQDEILNKTPDKK
tara:strand:+ start:4787 stop:7237 length:2451 start_codon:yes stop_codon:yes gene_type:complete